MDNAVLSQQLNERFAGKAIFVGESLSQVTMELPAEHLLSIAAVLRDDPRFAFAQMVDLCGVDYMGYGEDEWVTDAVSNEGFSRGVEGQSMGRFKWGEKQAVADPRRFAVVVHLLSLSNNARLRLRYFAVDEELPKVPSLVDVWPGANWFEREAFDLFGIVFEGHPDLRRLLTDYGFIGHPFRKDFPLIGNVEVRYDAHQGRVVYEPVSIEPRVLVPRVIRDDSRYEQSQAERLANQAQGGVK